MKVENVGDKQDTLVQSLQECVAGRCSRPTSQYEKLDTIDMQRGGYLAHCCRQPSSSTAGSLFSSRLSASSCHIAVKVVSNTAIQLKYHMPISLNDAQQAEGSVARMQLSVTFPPIKCYAQLVQKTLIGINISVSTT